MAKDERRTVYSTNPKFCPRCGYTPCRCKRARSKPPGEQTAGISREKKGRGGKTVTVIRGLELTADDLKALSSELKKACGTGGTARDGVIEIQGDHREKLAAHLRSLGYKTKFTGG